MLDQIKKMLGFRPQVDFKKLREEGAPIIDVRTKSEFAGGSVRGAVNIPLNDLGNHLHRFPNKEKPIITCCASGMRSASAKTILESKGYKQVFNGGSWGRLNEKIH